ncbi:hypothetical protein AX774_g5446 [Zancudomyces culisetae]|uniref:Uncharacterized protein n=1 Tax=Zancudomyces culisetae TaxID=1213189 RepID=A0A1R1PJF0_ZANCU|nr:hypothetical protein AX774_g5446 [Zancudomyces culisetae]|eukprot:OMH81101.1 hypothetical protein AX774_g5446 [Zancudomyces culisetae]
MFTTKRQICHATPAFAPLLVTAKFPLTSSTCCSFSISTCLSFSRWLASLFASANSCSVRRRSCSTASFTFSSTFSELTNPFSFCTLANISSSSSSVTTWISL